MFVKGIIEFELRIFNCFGHTIYLILAIMYEYLWVGHRNDVYFPVSQFVMEYRPLLETHTDFHLIGECVLSLARQLLLLDFDHGLEVDVHLDALQLVVRFPLALQLSDFFHLQPSRISVDFDLVYFVRGCDFSGLQCTTLGCHQGRIRHV